MISLLTATICISGAAHAACSNPAGTKGNMIYNKDFRVLQYCNAADQWIALMDRPAPGHGNCTGPVRAEGVVIYNGDENVPQLCSGKWQALGPLNSGAAGGGCSLPNEAEGTIIYNDDDDIMQYCNGSAWVRLHGPPASDCVTPGDICLDGTIYAGLTPDGNVPMYVTRCDLGLTLNGAFCEGYNQNYPWNNGNSSGKTTTGFSSATDGDGNTAGIILLDSDSSVGGTQPHQAAQACADLNLHGHTDWYLPARNEMTVIYESLQEGTPNDSAPDPIIDGFNAAYYHTSSETGTANWTFSMNTGSQHQYSSQAQKQNARPVRCARHN